MATAAVGLAEELNEDSRPVHENVGSLTFRHILEQEETCTTFLFLAKQTGSLLRSLTTDLLQIELPKQVTYLLDCDVVRNYAERRLSDTPQMFAVEALFETDDTPYMLPGGAFQEMVEWLGKDLHLDDLVQGESTLTKEEFLLQLLRRLEEDMSALTRASLVAMSC